MALLAISAAGIVIVHLVFTEVEVWFFQISLICVCSKLPISGVLGKKWGAGTKGVGGEGSREEEEEGEEREERERGKGGRGRGKGRRGGEDDKHGRKEGKQPERGAGESRANGPENLDTKDLLCTSSCYH